MKARLALIADAANVSREGKLNILGQFDTLWAQTVPVVWPSMVLVLKVEATAGEGPKHKLGLRIVDEDGNAAGPGLDADIEFGKPAFAGLPFGGHWILPINNAYFPKFGTYTFEVLGDNNNIESVELYVRKLEKK